MNRARLMTVVIIILVTQWVSADIGLCRKKIPLAIINNLIAKEHKSLKQLYQHLHANPELSLYEKQTSARMAQELQRAGYQVTTNVGGLGVVGVLENGKGPVVMIRTDMDALPIVEQTGLSYASRVTAKNSSGKEVGVMHACGHDLHMTVFVGTARLLSQLKYLWRGTLLMVSQPAEEVGQGSKTMLANGLFSRFPRPDFAIALHNTPELAAGQVGYRSGYFLANVDSLDIVIYGSGGHGAQPHLTKDPVVMAAQLILALQTIVSREINPVEPVVVTVGSIHGGTRYNIIPDQVQLQLTVRTFADTTREKVLAAIKNKANGIAQAAGIPAERYPRITLADETTASVYNDPELTDRVMRVFKQILGPKNVIASNYNTVGEDFSHYGRVEPKIPICLFWLGTADPHKLAQSKQEKTQLPPLHSPHYLPSLEPSIKTGLMTMTSVAIDLLQR